MKSFKEFVLNEASSGKDKWEKYFSHSDVQTLITKDTDVYEGLTGKVVTGRVQKNDDVVVKKSDFYASRVQIAYKDGFGYVPLTSVAKPISTSAGRVKLKPDELGITGNIPINNLADACIAKVKAAHEVSDQAKDYLAGIIQYMTGEITANQLKELWAFTSQSSALVRAVNNDFLEIAGAFEAAKFSKATSGTVYFPVLGNEPLYDFKILKGNEEIQFSSKTSSSKTTNVLKPNLFINLIPSHLKSKYRDEMEVIEILANSSIKDAPVNLAKSLTRKGFAFEEFDYSDLKKLWELERDVIKFINERMNFLELVSQAIPELFYIKGKIVNGVPEFKIEKGSDLKKVYLRSKNSSTGRFKDKIGIQM